MPGSRIRELLGAWLLVCGSIAEPEAARAQSPAEELRRALTAEVQANPSLPGELLHVLAPARGVDVSLAAGVFDRASGRPLQPHHGFRVASVTKTFVAAAILRLHEQGRLSVDDPIARHLPPELAGMLRADGYALDSITVRHLLTHTSGIHDYATEERYYAAVFGDPTHRWTREEQVRRAMEWGEPRFRPGAGFHYSDTGYVLLGQMLERITGRPLAQALRTLLDFERLGLDETYLETLEPAPAGAGERSHSYYGDIDTAAWDPSFDLYGGGGLVSSADDLARFFRALGRGELFQRPETLRMMLSAPATNANAPGGPYAMGVQRRMIGGEECWGHMGFWGTAVYHCAAADVTVVRHTNQAQPGQTLVYRQLFDRIAQVLGMGS